MATVAIPAPPPLHPFSGSLGGFKHPDFSLESRPRKPAASSSAFIIPDGQGNTFGKWKPPSWEAKPGGGRVGNARPFSKQRTATTVAPASVTPPSRTHTAVNFEDREERIWSEAISSAIENSNGMLELS
jgi:hypothetical protein